MTVCRKIVCFFQHNCYITKVVIVFAADIGFYLDGFDRYAHIALVVHMDLHLSLNRNGVYWWPMLSL